MNINKSSISKNKLFLIASAVFIVTALTATGVYAFINTSTQSEEKQSNPAKSSSTDASLTPPTPTELQDGQKTKENSIQQYENDPSGSASPDTTTVTITSANKTSTSLEIRTLISSLWPNGECVLTLSQGLTKKTYNAPTSSFANTSTCSGFSIPVSDLGSGTWNILITVTHNKSVISAESSVEI